MNDIRGTNKRDIEETGHPRSVLRVGKFLEPIGDTILSVRVLTRMRNPT